MKMIRSFVAVDLPPKFHQEIARIEAKINIPGLKIVKPELIHLTLKFLGEVPEDKIDEIASALEKVKMEPFSARIRGAGAFPGKSIRVVWLGLEGRFEELQRLVEEALGPFGFEEEDKKFSPHLTLARVRQPNPSTTMQLSEKITQLADVDLGEFTVDRIYLKKSTLTPGGPFYENLSEHVIQPSG